MISESAEFFSTLAGYMTICRLARSDLNYSFLKQVLELEGAEIRYCTLIKNDDGKQVKTDLLKEALDADAPQNTRLILGHLKDSLALKGIDYAPFLLKHHKDLFKKAYITL